MPKKVNPLFLIILSSVVTLTACSTSRAPIILPSEMDCPALLEQIETTQEQLTTLDKKANDQNGGGVRTGGVIGAQGGSNSGLNLGVGISIGTTFNNYRRHNARMEAEKVRERLEELQSEAVHKRCNT